MPFGHDFRIPFDHHNNDLPEAQDPTSSTTHPSNPNDGLEAPEKQLDSETKHRERENLRQTREQEKEAKHRAREHVRQQQEEEKEEKRQEVLDQRYEKECDRAEAQRAHRLKKRAEGHFLGCNEHLGEDPLSDIKLMKHAIGVEIRQRMPGWRWQDPREE